MSRPIHVAILGATGYGAGELLRLFVQHPRVEVVSVTTTSRAGEPLVKVHPHLRGFYDLELTPTLDRERWLAAEYAVVISALPHGASGPAVDALLRDLEAGSGHEHVRLIDLSGDWRLQNTELHRQHYPDSPLLPERRGTFVYGLPELFREEIRTARRIANPGCLASASILAAAPLVTPEFAGPLVIDAKTGSSGSGRTLKDTTHHPTRHADHRAYRPLEHPHEPEILQALGDPTGGRVQLSFVAQSLDVARGIFVTVHATLPEAVRTCDLRRHYADFYRDRPFIRVVDESPRLQDVVGSNFCDLAVACRGRQIVVMAALDNLVKGMAGTAVQNMNLMCGLPETTGLWAPSFRPV
jgi:LysW-gamma-L-alpha-aminoadipyl-6-phosphate/LysW-L-glutamyl-5-phosphate reductase